MIQNNSVNAGVSRHIDLGCGRKPRNPYGRKELHGVDIDPGLGGAEMQLLRANLAVDPIPYPDSHFDSVSAYDFLEHVPRVLIDITSKTSRLPFIELMNEVHRILKPGGLLYASTPCYPDRSVFGDPTHVNFVTDETHWYFCGSEPMGRMYGFKGRFDLVRTERFTPNAAHVYQPPRREFWFRLARRLQRSLGLSSRGSHVLWELRAVK